MPKKSTIERAKSDLRRGKSASTAAGEFIREEMENLQEEKPGVGSRKQAIAIGLAKARRAGVPLKPQKHTPAAEKTRREMAAAYSAGQHRKKASRRRTRG